MAAVTRPAWYSITVLDILGRSLEITEWIAHPKRLRNALLQLKLIYSNTALPPNRDGLRLWAKSLKPRLGMGPIGRWRPGPSFEGVEVLEVGPLDNDAVLIRPL